MGLVETMVGLSYLKMEDVPQIPKRRTPLRVAVYAPLAAAPVPPDVVLVRGNARQLMLLAEAAQAAGAAGTGATMGRPTCAVLPEAINSIANRRQFRLRRQPRLHRRRRDRCLLRDPRLAARARRGEPGGDRARQPGAGEVPPGARRRCNEKGIGMGIGRSGGLRIPSPPNARRCRTRAPRAGIVVRSGRWRTEGTPRRGRFTGLRERIGQHRTEQ